VILRVHEDHADHVVHAVKDRARECERILDDLVDEETFDRNQNLIRKLLIFDV
jgi:hypothetical protein